MNPKISELLTKINAFVEAQANSPLSTLEFDLLKQNIRSLYELIVEQQKPAIVPIVTKERVKETTYEPIITQPIIEAPTVSQVVATPDIVKPVVIQQPTIVAPPQLTDTEHKKEETSSVETNVTYKSNALNEITKTSVSINEKWVTTSVEMHKKLASKPLRELIDFNKRFAIVNELFKGDTAAFQQTVSALDEATSYEQAENIYTQLANSQAWDLTAQTTRLFGKLIKQRFGME
jgi:hypothetical protein